MKKNDQEMTQPIKKQDKVIRPSEIPGRDAPSGFQPPHRPGYDVMDSRGPGAIKEVGDMGERIYPSGLDDADMERDLSHDATNRIGGFGSQTDSDPHNASGLQLPKLAEKPRGENTPESVESVGLSGADSDPAFDRFPQKQR